MLSLWLAQPFTHTVIHAHSHSLTHTCTHIHLRAHAHARTRINKDNQFPVVQMVSYNQQLGHFVATPPLSLPLFPLSPASLSFLKINFFVELFFSHEILIPTEAMPYMTNTCIALDTALCLVPS